MVQSGLTPGPDRLQLLSQANYPAPRRESLMKSASLTYDFENSVGYWIAITSHFYGQKLNQQLAPYGITYRQFQVLVWLIYEGDLTPAQLAARLMIEPPTLTRILDRMERHGWIARCEHHRDGRRKQVRLLPAAKRIWSQVTSCLQEARSQATRGMTEQEVRQLRMLLARVHQNLAADSDTGRVQSQVLAAGSL